MVIRILFMLLKFFRILLLDLFQRGVFYRTGIHPADLGAVSDATASFEERMCGFDSASAGGGPYYEWAFDVGDAFLSEGAALFIAVVEEAGGEFVGVVNACFGEGFVGAVVCFCD